MAAINYDDVINQLVDAGLILEDGVQIGGGVERVRVQGRDRERRGWYILHSIMRDSGDEVIVGSYGVWEGNENNERKIRLGANYKISKEQQKAIDQRVAEDRKKAEILRKAQAAKASRLASERWKSAQIQGECDYLARKGVSAHGVRFLPEGEMLVPMCNAAGRIQGLQIIRSSTQEGMPKEYWPKGLSKNGSFHTVGGLSASSGIILIAEGYATAASLYEATGLPVACAFDAGNLKHVADALHKRYPKAEILVCADDDQAQKCRSCKQRVWISDGATCPHCEQEHKASNAGVVAASAASVAVGGAWVTPVFEDAESVREAWLRHGRKTSDYNDLHTAEGLAVVRSQIEEHISGLKWAVGSGSQRRGSGASAAAGGGGGSQGGGGLFPPVRSLDDVLERFYLIYSKDSTVFDEQEHRLISQEDVRNLCGRHLYREWLDHPERKIVHDESVGFDPSCKDEKIICNTWAGWPTKPVAGKCTLLLELLEYLCSDGGQSRDTYQFVLKWLAYPLQNPGAKMKTALVVHGPQGTGKNLFFEAIMSIYGRYGRIIDQSAIEDKFNEWASRKLFLIADEVVARSDLYHVKNKLKAFITGDWIRINPKNIKAYDERNHVNMVFLSNEAMPVVIEPDDRRHMVIWTPEKLSPVFYKDVIQEIKDGGAAALHHYLLHLDLGDFHAGTLPPMTGAKQELIDLSKDSVSRFAQAFEGQEIDGFASVDDRSQRLNLPAQSAKLYELYQEFCRRSGMRTVAVNRFVSTLKRMHGAQVRRSRYVKDRISMRQTSFISWGNCQRLPEGDSEAEWLGRRITSFDHELSKYKQGVVS